MQRVYLCGPTVYKPSHIGHAVGPVIFDALKKYLVYKGYDVKFVMNITDVDDKLIIEAAARGISIGELAEEVSAKFFDAMETLGVDSVDNYPRATEHIEQIIELIQQLSERVAAYQVDGDVYFDISKCPDYGKLSHRRVEDQVEGSRDLAGATKRNPGDFAMWKAAPADQVGWESPWGRGRPGWHIECSAMSCQYLGETFDIHGGGMDLIFPHHENEIAQSETAHGKTFAKYWMHNGLTRIRTKAASGEWQNEKMSKSLGNIKALSDVLTEYPPQVIRFFLLSTHYRRPIDFSDDSIQAMQKGMMGIYRLLERINRLTGEDLYNIAHDIGRMTELANSDADKQFVNDLNQQQLRYLESLDDDFNTAGAISVLFDLCSLINRHADQQKLDIKPSEESLQLISQAARLLTTLGQVLGLLTGPLDTVGSDQLTEQLMQLLIEMRADARKQKNFALADAIRDKLTAIDVSLEDLPSGTIWRKE